jgi:hypothetical protein
MVLHVMLSRAFGRFATLIFSTVERVSVSCVPILRLENRVGPQERASLRLRPEKRKDKCQEPKIPYLQV